MRKVINYGDKTEENLIIALGYFDAVHKGHKKVLEKAVSIAKSKGVTPAVLIFTGGKHGKDIFNLFERSIKLFSTKIEVVIVKELSSDFLKKSSVEFLDELSALYRIDGVVCGSDFTFGNGAKGNVKTLIEFFGKDKVFCENLVEENNEKISSTAIKTALEKGDILLANELLGDNYFIAGKVIKGKALGKTIGFPTANISISDDKFPLKMGVYLTFSIIDGKAYPSITNVGNQPTVNGQNSVLETHIKGFSDDLYDKILTVYFVSYIREIKKFSSLEELKNQLVKDLSYTI